MTDVWVGYEHDYGEQGYSEDHITEPLVVFANVETANIWKKLGRNRKTIVLRIQTEVECHTCRSKLK